MRKPTPDSVYLAWWRAAMAGERPQVLAEPQCGWYLRRFVRFGPRIPVRIYLRQELDEDGFLINPEELIVQQGLTTNPDHESVWLSSCANPITYLDWRIKMAEMGWADQREGEPLATPAKPLNLLSVPVPVLTGKRKT